MSLFKHPKHEIPALNTASMPDLVFTVLFFFMIATHMKEVPVKVNCRVPQSQQLDKLSKKTAVSYIYIGRLPGDKSGHMAIQLNDRIATTDEISTFIASERASMNDEDLENMTVSLRADKDTPMAIISEVKYALRRVEALRIHYSAEQRKQTQIGH